jgi:hypothetical protein
MIDYSNIFETNGLNYSSYRRIIDDLLANSKTTGPDDSEAMLHYSKMNVQRMSRVDKTVQLIPELNEIVQLLPEDLRFLVISEGWCGDAAQIVPVFNKLAEASQGKIALKFVLRDQHLELIDAHLTNGGRAIPVLLVLDAEGKVVHQWGPRPAILQGLLAEWKKESSDMMLLAERLHSWYAKDRTLTTQSELLALLKEID